MNGVLKRRPLLFAAIFSAFFITGVFCLLCFIFVLREPIMLASGMLFIVGLWGMLHLNLMCRRGEI